MKIKFRLLLVSICSTTGILVAQHRIQPFKQGDFRLDLKLPHFNYLSFNPDRKFRDAEFGFNGYGLGIEYSYRDNRFFEVSTSFAMTAELPFPAPVDAEYNKILSSYYVNLTHNNIKNRFSFGYGLNYSMNTWKEWTRDLTQINLPTTSSRAFVNRNLGLTFNSYYRLGRTIHIGLVYQPSLWNLDSKQLIYEHLIGLEINWRIKLFNSQKMH